MRLIKLAFLSVLSFFTPVALLYQGKLITEKREETDKNEIKRIRDSAASAVKYQADTIRLAVANELLRERIRQLAVAPDYRQDLEGIDRRLSQLNNRVQDLADNVSGINEAAEDINQLGKNLNNLADSLEYLPNDIRSIKDSLNNLVGKLNQLPQGGQGKSNPDKNKDNYSLQGYYTSLDSARVLLRQFENRLDDNIPLRKRALYRSYIENLETIIRQLQERVKDLQIENEKGP